jgi:ABC-type nitrate/sulfonate/bicarbonate transport system substrate-binding protein
MISVQLDWKPNAQFAGLLLADHRGWFTDAGIDLTILPWQPATDPVRDVGNRLGHVAVSEDNLAISAAAAGVDIVILGSMLRSSPLAWMVPQDSGIETFADFAGASVSMSWRDGTRLRPGCFRGGRVDQLLVRSTSGHWSKCGRAASIRACGHETSLSGLSR